MSDLIMKEELRDICILTINRPEKRNALSPEIVKEMRREIENLNSEDQVKVVILTGAGNAFCAGADLAYLQQISEYSDKENRQDSGNLAELFHIIYSLPKITVAMVNGPALAGGCGLALCCDYIFASSEYAKLGFTEVRIGFVPAIVMNFLIRKISLQDAFHLAINGQIVTAEQAEKIDLVYQVCAHKNLRDDTVKFAGDLLERNSFAAMVQTKRLFQQLLELPLTSGLSVASEVNAQSRKTADCQKGLENFLHKKSINWRDSV
jgi:methylglutaconyl-CoA hydratase